MPHTYSQHTINGDKPGVFPLKPGQMKVTVLPSLILSSVQKSSIATRQEKDTQGIITERKEVRLSLYLKDPVESSRNLMHLI